MPDGTGIDQVLEKFPDRSYDVGIAEQHAVTFCAGLATEGLKPVAAIYSTFLQRGFDQVIHDVALQNLNVTFAMDRAGIVGADGPTHHGLLDIAYFRGYPNMTLMAPKDEAEMRDMLLTAVEQEGPTGIRYPRGAGVGADISQPPKKLEVGKAEYDGYIRNGMMTQLSRLDLGADIEEAHMRNRQLVASWAFEKGQADNVISKLTRDGKTYFEVNDYEKLRDLFGQLLKEIQRIKSEGDYEAGKNLVENYGVKVDQEIHKEVLDRVKPLNIQPYRGFVNPKIVPVTNNAGEITDFTIEYQNYDEQMLEYSKRFAFLPEYN